MENTNKLWKCERLQSSVKIKSSLYSWCEIVGVFLVSSHVTPPLQLWIRNVIISFFYTFLYNNSFIGESLMRTKDLDEERQPWSHVFQVIGKPICIIIESRKPELSDSKAFSKFTLKNMVSLSCWPQNRIHSPP